MKKLSILSLIAFVAIIISSCSTSNSVVSNNGISKRKYNKGFFINRKSNFRTADAKVKEADIKEDKAIAKAEKVEARKAKKAIKVENNAENTSVAVVESEELNEEINTTYTERSVRTSSENLGEDELMLEETKNEVSESNESTEETTVTSDDASAQNSSKRGPAGNVHIVILVILALIIPPLAVFLFEGATGRFWIDLVLALLGFGLGIGLGGLAYLAALAAVIYALLIVLNVI